MEHGNANLKVVVDNMHGTHTEGLRALKQVLDESVTQRHINITPEWFKSCTNDVALLRRTQPSVVDKYVPVFVLVTIIVC